MTFPKLRFSKFKKFIFRSVFRELQLTQISLNFKTSRCNLEIFWSSSKTVCDFSVILILKRRSKKSNSPCILLSKNIIFNKNETESKIANMVLERRTLRFTSFKNRKLKVKLWWVGVCDRKKKAFFVQFIFIFTEHFVVTGENTCWSEHTCWSEILIKLLCIFLENFFIKIPLEVCFWLNSELLSKPSTMPIPKTSLKSSSLTPLFIS